MTGEARLKHVYLMGATGSGKTNCLLRLLEGDIAAGHSFCVIDLRGDLVDRVLRRLAAVGPEKVRGRLAMLDLRDERVVLPFNPLAGPGDPYGRALHVLSVIKAQADSWGVQLDETLRNALMVLAETGWTLLELEPLLSNDAFREHVLAGVSDTYVRGFFERYNALSPEKQMAWRLPVLNKVTPLLCLPQLRRLFGAREAFDLGGFFNGEPGAMLLVSLAVDRLHEAAHLAGGLIVSALQAAMMARVDQSEGDRRPVYLYIDEFETMASDRFEAIVAEGRRFGLGLTLSHQNLSQLPASLRQAVRNNVGTQLLFQTGAVDASELAREIVADADRESLRTALMTQRVGEAFVVRRGRQSCRIRVPRSPDPPVSSESIKEIGRIAGESLDQKSSEVEAELARRSAFIAGLAASPTRGRTAAYEVRDARRPRFAA
ncbi:MAG TPA: type IV secretion system DNA-binding domain-containing protein [Armatimonadota bacterium]